jgi:hypothetical protein
MNKNNFQKAINKYGILLSISYLTNLIWVYFAHEYFSQFVIENQNELFEYISYVPRIIRFFINVICAILVFQDFKKNGIKSPLIVLITLLFGFIGIALFFIQIIFERHINKASTQQGVNKMQVSSEL